jgi:hypothetical protein
VESATDDRPSRRSERTGRHSAPLPVCARGGTSRCSPGWTRANNPSTPGDGSQRCWDVSSTRAGSAPIPASPEQALELPPECLGLERAEDRPPVVLVPGTSFPTGHDTSR